MGTVEVRYKPMNTAGNLIGYHKFLVYVDESGAAVRYGRGGPQYEFGTPGYAEHGFGKIVTESEAYVDGTLDYNNTGQPWHKETVATDVSLQEWYGMEQTLQDLENENHDYFAGSGPNSNSTVDETLRRHNHPRPNDDDAREWWSPGSDYWPSFDESTWPWPIPPWDPADPDNPLKNPPVSPLILDLDGDGIELTPLEGSNVFFDLDADGFAERTGWVTGGDGMLVRDANGNGRIDDINELFGNETTDGFTVLRPLDANQDGVVDSADAGYAALRVWIDADNDAITDSGELKTLQELGIASIDVNATAVNQTIAGHDVTHTASYRRTDGSSAAIVDVWYENDQLTSRHKTPDGFMFDPEARMLPFLKGYGAHPRRRLWAIAGVALMCGALQACDRYEARITDALEGLSEGRGPGYLASFDYVCFDFVSGWAREEFGKAAVRASISVAKSLATCGQDGSCCGMDSDLVGAVGLVKDGVVRCVGLRGPKSAFLTEAQRPICAKPSEIIVRRETFRARVNPPGRPWFSTPGQTYYNIREQQQ